MGGIVNGVISQVESYVADEQQFCSIVGPACSIDEMRLTYSCNFQKCRIGCPCYICNNIGINCNENCNNRCKKCPLQCTEHKLGLPRTFNAEVDHFTIVTSQENGYHFATPYAGIPTTCQACSEDLLQHQVLHLVFHMNCKFCQQEFMPFKLHTILTVDDYKKGEIEMFKEEDSTCTICFKLFDDRAARKRHQRRSHGTFTCSQCGTVHTSKMKLEYHLKTSHNAENIVKFRSKAQDSYEKTKELIECSKCSSKFFLEQNLRRHMKEVHLFTDKNIDYVQYEDMTFKCKECSSSFLRQSYLKRHEETVHAVDRKISCPSCGNEFSRKCSYLRHLKNKICSGTSP